MTENKCGCYCPPRPSVSNCGTNTKEFDGVRNACWWATVGWRGNASSPFDDPESASGVLNPAFDFYGPIHWSVGSYIYNSSTQPILSPIVGDVLDCTEWASQVVTTQAGTPNERQVYWSLTLTGKEVGQAILKKHYLLCPIEGFPEVVEYKNYWHIDKQASMPYSSNGVGIHFKVEVPESLPESISVTAFLSEVGCYQIIEAAGARINGVNTGKNTSPMIGTRYNTLSCTVEVKSGDVQGATSWTSPAPPPFSSGYPPTGITFSDFWEGTRTKLFEDKTEEVQLTHGLGRLGNTDYYETDGNGNDVYGRTIGGNGAWVQYPASSEPNSSMPKAWQCQISGVSLTVVPNCKTNQVKVTARFGCSWTGLNLGTINPGDPELGAGLMLNYAPYNILSFWNPNSGSFPDLGCHPFRQDSTLYEFSEPIAPLYRNWSGYGSGAIQAAQQIEIDGGSWDIFLGDKRWFEAIAGLEFSGKLKVYTGWKFRHNDPTPRPVFGGGSPPPGYPRQPPCRYTEDWNFYGYIVYPRWAECTWKVTINSFSRDTAAQPYRSNPY